MQVLQLPCSPVVALVLLFHPRLGVLVMKNLPRWMLLSLGMILPLEAVCGTQDLPWGGWGLGQKGHCSPWLEALHRELDTGWTPHFGCLVLADDGMLGASPLLLAGAM